MNLAAYDAKIQELEKEKADWDAQRKAASELTGEINKKETEAVAERQKWTEKRKGYRAEAEKWLNNARTAEQTYTKFKRLGD